jgi:alkylation response protein AidB-like acyl-CoA dehydrogenase
VPGFATKAHIAEQAIWVAHQAVQLHGGMGMSDELGIGHGLKRIVLLSKLFGDPASGIHDYARAA